MRMLLIRNCFFKWLAKSKILQGIKPTSHCGFFLSLLIHSYLSLYLLCEDKNHTCWETLMIRLKWPHVHCSTASHAAFEKNSNTPLFRREFVQCFYKSVDNLRHRCQHATPANNCSSWFATWTVSVKAGQQRQPLFPFWQVSYRTAASRLVRCTSCICLWTAKKI